MANKINHEGRGGHRVAVFFVFTMISWFFQIPFQKTIRSPGCGTIDVAARGVI